MGVNALKSVVEAMSLPFKDPQAGHHGGVFFSFSEKVYRQWTQQEGFAYMYHVSFPGHCHFSSTLFLKQENLLQKTSCRAETTREPV